MTTNDPLSGPFMSATRITDSSDDEGYAILPSVSAAPSRATLLRQAAIGQ